MAKHNLLAIYLEKNVFQICGITQRNKATFNRTISRGDIAIFITHQAPSVIAIQPRYSNRHWAKYFMTTGHSVKFLMAQYVSPFIINHKINDDSDDGSNDTVAIENISRRPRVCTISVKSLEQHDTQTLHCIRERRIDKKTASFNKDRELLTEYGIIFVAAHKYFSTVFRKVTVFRKSTVFRKATVFRKITSFEKQAMPTLTKNRINQSTDKPCAHINTADDTAITLTKLTKNNLPRELLMTILEVVISNFTAIYCAIGNGPQFKNARELAV
ncbi:MAG: hypothetical protein ACI93R_003007 [Flavobacteriales bacterium]|jgi:hypothetical protein